MKKFLLAFFTLLVLNAQSQTLPNSGFETWEFFDATNYPGLEVPQQYSTSDIFFTDLEKQTNTNPNGTFAVPTSVEKTVSARSGTYAVSIKNVESTVTALGFTLVVDTLPGAITLIGDEGSGIPVTQRITSFSGFYKFNQGAPGSSQVKDTAFIALILTKWNPTTKQSDSIGEAVLEIVNNAVNYTPFTVNAQYINASIIPDSASIFVSSSSAFKCFPGTMITVDDLSLSTVTGNKISLFAQSIQVYPNPASEVLNFKNLPEEAASVTVKDFTGRAMFSSEVNSGASNVVTKELSSGVYFYSISDANGNILYSSKFIVNN